MSKEKQIDEIAKLICTYPQCVHYNIIGECANCECQTVDIAKSLYDAGYRKQSKKESKGCEYCKGRAYTKKPLTVITKYGRRIELVFEFCPNCGRKMKGGADGGGEK